MLMLLLQLLSLEAPGETEESRGSPVPTVDRLSSIRMSSSLEDEEEDRGALGARPYAEGSPGGPWLSLKEMVPSVRSSVVGRDMSDPSWCWWAGYSSWLQSPREGSRLMERAVSSEAHRAEGTARPWARACISSSYRASPGKQECLNVTGFITGTIVTVAFTTGNLHS